MVISACRAPNAAYHLSAAPGENRDGAAEAGAVERPGASDAPDRDLARADAASDTQKEAGAADKAGADKPVVDALATPQVTCPQDPNLVACFRFEGAVQDESPTRLGPASLVNAGSFVAGPDGQAMSVDPMTIMQFQDSPALAPSRVTIEAWLRPRRLPALGERMGIVDRVGVFGLFVMPAGELECRALVNGAIASVAAADALQIDTWSSVACTI